MEQQNFYQAPPKKGTFHRQGCHSVPCLPVAFLDRARRSHLAEKRIEFTPNLSRLILTILICFYGAMPCETPILSHISTHRLRNVELHKRYLAQSTDRTSGVCPTMPSLVRGSKPKVLGRSNSSLGRPKFISCLGVACLSGWFSECVGLDVTDQFYT